MKSKWKVLLSCLAVAFTMSVYSACAPTENSGTNSPSSPQQSSPAEPDTPDVPDTPVTPDNPDVPDTPVTPATYTVKFVDEDGTELSSTTYEEGATVVEPTAPTKAADNTYTYAFAGWDKEVTAAAADVTYTATYTATYIEYEIVFLNDDDSEIARKNYHYGDEVVVPTATKAADNTYTYEFAGWDNEVVAVAGAATYKATYTATYIEYAVAFVNDDGTEISTANYHYGDAVIMPETTPVKKATEVYSYSFAAWDKEVATVTETATYTATYTATLNSGLTAYKTTAAQGESVVLDAGSIGAGANYTQGQQVGGSIDQAYLAFDGDYSFNDYIAFDFTGKNMPEIAFFAKNYNNSMYAEEKTKQGIVVASGITTYNGEVNTDGNILNGGKKVAFDSPFMIQNTEDGWIRKTVVNDSKLGRANLVDGAKYRVIMGWTTGSTHGANGITLNWVLYNAETGEVLEEGMSDTWNFFTGSSAQVNNMTLNDLVGSIVLYGKFGTACALDKVYGVFEDTTIANVAAGLNSEETFTVTFKDDKGNVLQTNENVAFGEKVTFTGEMPTLDKAEDDFYTYAYAWDKPFGKITQDTEYTLTFAKTLKSGYKANNAEVVGNALVLGKGEIGSGANYTQGQQVGGSINQAYFAYDGNYGLDNYIVFEFTGKNMPEIAFFAKNYNASMYKEDTDKQGIVVVSGITNWDGTSTQNVNTSKTVGTYLNYDFPYMIENAAHGDFCEGAFTDTVLGRENLVDGKQYRVIMGFTNYGASALDLKWCVYDVETNEIIEEGSQHTWNFFTGSNEKVGNMTLDDLSGAIVLYGKFGTTCTIDKSYGVVSDTYDNVKAAYAKAL